MLMDKELLFSEGQAVTATAASTNSLDVGAGVGQGEPIEVFVLVTEDFDLLTDLIVTLEGSSDDGDSDSFATVLSSPAIALASLKAGTEVFKVAVPAGTERYLQLKYTVNGTNPTTGKITAGLIIDRQTNV